VKHAGAYHDLVAVGVDFAGAIDAAKNGDGDDLSESFFDIYCSTITYFEKAWNGLLGSERSKFISLLKNPRRK